MATRKLSLPLFSAKTLVSQPGRSTRYLHFIDSVRQDRNQYSLVCESQPLLVSAVTDSPPIVPPAGRKFTRRRMRIPLTVWE